jgi:hypothetical protein
MSSKFSASEVCYKDTRGSGSISIHGIELHADEDGFIEAPASLAAELAPHGFVKADRPIKPATISLPKK